MHKDKIAAGLTAQRKPGTVNLQLASVEEGTLVSRIDEKGIATLIGVFFDSKLADRYMNGAGLSQYYQARQVFVVSDGLHCTPIDSETVWSVVDEEDLRESLI